MFLYYPMALTHGPLVSTPHEPFAESKLEKHKAMVRYTDYLVGRLVKALDDSGVRSNTLVIFTTDNGTSGGIHGSLNGRPVRGGKAQADRERSQAALHRERAGHGARPGS